MEQKDFFSVAPEVSQSQVEIYILGFEAMGLGDLIFEK
jgi:hypothetical protein